MQQNQPRKQRHLAWDGCYNVRDLGGLPTVDGSETRWQTVIRADVLSRLTGCGKRALLDYGVRTVIDLREQQEAQREPSSFVGCTDLDITNLNIPLEKYAPHASALISRATTRAEVYCNVLDHSYGMVSVMRGIANAGPGGLVIHCYGGKDRTGIVAALLLSLAGVPSDTIAADYTESQERLRPLYEHEEAVDIGLKQSATAETMHTMLAHLETRHGGVRRYLASVGLTNLEIESIANRLRTS